MNPQQNTVETDFEAILRESGFQDECPIVGKLTTRKALEIFEQHVSKKGLNHSAKRDQIVKVFLETQKHVSAEDLHELVRREDPQIGYTTVYRTLKLIIECGLAEMVDFNEGVRRYEKKLGREYHAHFICTSCGDHFEIFHQGIEALANKLANSKGFLPQKHRLEIFGLCKKCNRLTK